MNLKNECTDITKKETLTPKKIGGNIMDALSGSLIPLIPMLIAAAMFKTIVAILGPDMLGLLNAESDLYTLFTFVGDAGFYFFPIVVGYTASKKLGVTPVLGMFLGGIMLHPSLMDIAAEGTAFTVYGIPCSVQNYSATIIPIILSVWIMSYIEKLFNKIIPSFLQVVLVPFLTILVMIPISLCALGPAGVFAGNYISQALLSLGEFGGIVTILAIALIGALWEFLVLSGMHWILLSTMIVVVSSVGQESVVSAALGAASFSVGGMCFGAFLLQKSKEEKSLSLSYVISQVIGGVTEPGLYGVGFGYKRPFIGMMAGGFAGALYGAVVGLTAYNIVPVASFLWTLCYAGGSAMNFIHGCISCGIAFLVSTIVTYVIGLKKT